ncbi:multidrug resistance efflux pump [Actinoplanes lutulentus]|uniref:HlyD family secretion protein n=1 Tax=Actinoplanes lutulentus TaxID=1287878 RepID=A0A327Z8T0_9ACTN|nr:HlyD family efflux transporter periplasmic adaptor subunit [Actinoplanes lutulentus]MBB2948340.1 multidrug resistance efflux pump [Actinoplanes lutulentus]RAK30372.1 HlyD family secretion protein [Actinoplanes lutulentus]
MTDTAVASYLETRRPAKTTGRKWRARLIVLFMVAAAVLIFVKLTADRVTDAARIDLGTVTLTAQPIPVETPRPGQITQVSVRAEQQVKAGAKLGVVEVTTTDSDGEPVLRKLTLVAPRAGIVVDQPATMGSTLQPGQPFVELYDPAELTFVTDVPVESLPELSPGMVARLEAEGLDRVVKATVQRVVPRVDDGDGAGAAPGFLRVVLLPADAAEVRDLVPGMRFTGAVDIRTGAADARLVALR